MVKKVIKIPKGISQDINIHPEYYSLSFWLLIKPFYVSSVIKNEAGKYPYKKLTENTGYSDKAVRYKIKRLVELNLIRIDSKKNLILCSYNDFWEFIYGSKEFKGRVKCRFYNENKNIDEVLVCATIQDNFNKQNYNIREKTLIQMSGRTEAPEMINSKFAGLSVKKSDCIKKGSSLRRYLLKGIDENLKQCIETWKAEQLLKPIQESNFCPLALLSFKKLGELMDLTGGGAHYWFKKCEKSELINQEQQFLNDNTGALMFAKTHFNLPGVFPNRYRFKAPGKQSKALLKLCSIKTLNVNQLYD
jgi:hypothetical protein